MEPPLRACWASFNELAIKSPWAGFEVETLQQPVTDRAQVGKVVDEQSAGGRKAPAGSVITIYVGRVAG